MKTRFGIEWPTIVLLVLCYISWYLLIRHTDTIGTFATVVSLSLCLALFSSLQHEVLHRHPTQVEWINTLLVLPPIGFVFPYKRFKDLHLAHHRNQYLTDPYDDPESYYVHPDNWEKVPFWLKSLLSWNNTLAGRVAIGPALGIVGFMLSETKLGLRGDFRVLRAWIIHILLLVPLCYWLTNNFAAPWWIYAAGVYGGTAIIYVRTYLEHRAHENPAARTVIIEDRGLFSFLFLNNNLHAAHHLRPTMPWYALPEFYARNRDRLLDGNQDYRFRSYADIFRHYAFRRKEPVVHPLIRSSDHGQDTG